MRPHSFQFMPTCAVHTALARAHGCTPGCRGLPVAWLPQRGRIAAPCTIHTRCTYREGEQMQGRAQKRILQGYASAFHFGVVLAISQLTMAAPRE